VRSTLSNSCQVKVNIAFTERIVIIMRISTKSRYGLAAITYIGQNYRDGELITVIRISEKFGFSKIYLEQTFSLLKRAGLVMSAKGPQGGYQLTREPDQITLFDVLYAIESTLFDETEETVSEKDIALEMAMQECVFNPINGIIRDMLQQITIYDLIVKTEKCRGMTDTMYFI